MLAIYLMFNDFCKIVYDAGIIEGLGLSLHGWKSSLFSTLCFLVALEVLGIKTPDFYMKEINSINRKLFAIVYVVCSFIVFYSASGSILLFLAAVALYIVLYYIMKKKSSKINLEDN